MMLLIGFIVGEMILILLVWWIYRQIEHLEAFPPDPLSRRLAAIALFLIPVVLGLATLPGLLRRINQERALSSTVARLEATSTVVLPETGATSIALETQTATLEATPTSLPTTISPTAEPSNTPPPAPTNALPAMPTATIIVQPFPTAHPVQTLELNRVFLKATPAPNTTPVPTTEGVSEPTPVAPAADPEPLVTPAAPASQTPVLSEPVAAPPGRIVYVCQIFQDTNRDQICLMNADGSGNRRLTTDDNSDYHSPVLTPDGASMIYAGKETQAFEIYEMNLESEAVAQLTNGAGSSWAPDISPDGQQIVFTRRIDASDTLWVMNRDGSEARLIFGPPQGAGWDPVWSPDGEQILFASNRAGGVQMFTVQPDGTDQQQLTQVESLGGRSAWSREGASIAIFAGSPWFREIYRMNPDGSGLRQITKGGNNLSPSFSPDGQWIVFTSYRDNYLDDNGCEIYTLRADGSQVIRLTENDFCDWQPRWGP